jgi:hypothetical protein
MNVNGVGGNNQSAGIDQTAFQSRMQQAFGPVAQLLGESPDQLQSDLQTQGASLSSIAAQKGVSQTDLVNAIKQGLQQTSASGASPLSDNQLTNIANRIANHVHGHHHHHKASSTNDQTATIPPTTTPSDSTVATSL